LSGPNFDLYRGLFNLSAALGILIYNGLDADVELGMALFTM